jgi:hypothetical protein
MGEEDEVEDWDLKWRSREQRVHERVTPTAAIGNASSTRKHVREPVGRCS